MAILRLVYTLYLRLAGAGLLAIVATLTAAHSGYLDAGDAPSPPIWALCIAIALGLLFLVPWWQPYGLWKPGRRTDAVWVLPHSVVAALLPFLAYPFLALPFTPALVSSLSFDPIWANILPALLISALIVPRVRGGGKRADKKGGPDRRREPDPAPNAAPAARVAKATDPKLPAIGAALKLYVAADWLILRLMGLGLLAFAWMLHDFTARGREDKALTLTHGQDPQLAMWVVAAFGLVMALPILMPRAIARPRHVAGGMGKAAALVGAAFLLIEPMQMALVDATPKMYHEMLLAVVPKLFRAIAGVAVTSILLVAFFRQLGTLPGTDAPFDARPVMSLDDLRELRVSRLT